MRKLIMVMLIGISFNAFAEQDMPAEALIYCRTEFPTTSMFLRPTQGKESFTLTVTHHNGEKWMPVHKGVITVNDLPTIEERALKLLKMGAEYSVEFPKEQCRLIEGQEVSCYARGPLYIGEQQVQSVSFHNYTTQSRLFQQTFETHVVSMSVTIENRGLTQTMDYTPRDCFYQGFE